MRRFPLSLIFAFGCASFSGVAIASNTIEIRDFTPRYETIDLTMAKNSVRVRCDLGDNKVKQSRALVLQLDAAEKGLKGYEVALTTAHGLIDNNGDILDACFVMDSHGVSHQVEGVVFPNSSKSGTKTDWAIITFETSKDSHMVRYNLPSFAQKSDFDMMGSQSLSVKFSTAVGLSYNGQNCNLVSRKTAGLTSERYEGFLAHNCSAVAGQSGSPISMSRDGIPIVVGMHVGNSFSFGDPTKNVAPRFYGYMRAFDESFIEELDQLLLTLEHKMTSTHEALGYQGKHD